MKSLVELLFITGFAMLSIMVPFLKIETIPVDSEIVIARALVQTVIPAAAACRAPKPLGREPISISVSGGGRR